MKPAIHINDPAAWVRSSERIAQARGAAWQLLAYADTHAWSRDEWRVLEQVYDFEHRYLSYIEVDVYAQTAQIPLECPYDDLYWYYVLQGEMALQAANDTGSPLVIPEDHYRILYLPQDQYVIRLPHGKHRLLYITHKIDALTREESKVVDPNFPPMYAARNHLSDPVFTQLLRQDDGSSKLISAFLQKQSDCYLKRSLLVKELSIKLIYKAYDSLQILETKQRTDREWVESMVQYIDSCIEDGDWIDISILLRKHKMGKTNASEIFKKVTQQSLGAYMIDKKLEYSKAMLLQGDSVHKVALFLNMTTEHYIRAFKKTYGQTPKQFTKN